MENKAFEPQPPALDSGNSNIAQNKPLKKKRTKAIVLSVLGAIAVAIGVAIFIEERDMLRWDFNRQAEAMVCAAADFFGDTTIKTLSDYMPGVNWNLGEPNRFDYDMSVGLNLKGNTKKLQEFTARILEACFYIEKLGPESQIVSSKASEISDILARKKSMKEKDDFDRLVRAAFFAAYELFNDETTAQNVLSYYMSGVNWDPESMIDRCEYDETVRANLNENREDLNELIGEILSLNFHIAESGSDPETASNMVLERLNDGREDGTDPLNRKMNVESAVSSVRMNIITSLQFGIPAFGDNE